MKLTLHHIGILVNDIAKQASVYQDRFGYEPVTGIINDPEQTAWVQFVGITEDNVYLEFVSPDSPESKLSNLLSKGGGLHHLCYATDTIEESCANLRNTGMTLIRPPVSATAFGGRRIAWLRGRDGVLIELVERGRQGEKL